VSSSGITPPGDPDSTRKPPAFRPRNSSRAANFFVKRSQALSTGVLISGGAASARHPITPHRGGLGDNDIGLVETGPILTVSNPILIQLTAGHHAPFLHLNDILLSGQYLGAYERVILLSTKHNGLDTDSVDLHLKTTLVAVSPLASDLKRIKMPPPASLLPLAAALSGRLRNQVRGFGILSGGGSVAHIAGPGENH
jgi:hypothetical protein